MTGPIEHLERLREQLAHEIANLERDEARYEAELAEVTDALAGAAREVDEINAAIVVLRAAPAR